jgi:hypothetical protein
MEFINEEFKVLVNNENLELEVHCYFNEDTPPRVYKLPSKGVLKVEENLYPNSDSTYLTVEFEGNGHSYSINLYNAYELFIDEMDAEGEFYDTIGAWDFSELS